MKKLISSLIAVILILSCVTVNASASEQEEDVMKNYNYYCHNEIPLNTSKLPQYIKGRFDYDSNYIKIVPEYPGYEGRGYIFPLASEQYGALYDLSYTVEDTVITFEYRLKDGATRDKYLDCIDRNRAKEGLDPIVREEGRMYSYPLFDVALKEIVVIPAQVVEPIVLDVVNTDGTVDYKDGKRVGTSAGYQSGFLMRIPSLEPIPERPTEPVEENNYQYRDQLLSQYSLTKDQLTEYDEIYEHKDQYGEVDWVLVKAATEVKTSPLYTDPRYYEFGNRVMEVEYKGEPFTFGMGVYSVKDERFIQPGDAEMYELDDLEEVWTELGPGRLIGDMDGDNELSIADATLIRRCQAEIMDYPTEDQNIPLDYAPQAIKWFSDFDQDGDRSIMDATAIQRFLLGLPYRPADWTPYPHGGQEPTEPTEPQPTESQPTESQPTESQPTEPQPTEPQPTEPQPTEPQPDPSIPHITRCEAVKDGVQVTWTAVEGAEHYRLYYRNNSGSWTKCAETDGLTAVDTHAAPGGSYVYTVRCVSADGSHFMSDFDHNGVRFILISNPRIKNLKVRLDGVEFDVWAQECRVRIYRKDGGSWKRIGEFDSQKRENFRDTDVEPGKTYTYTARCVSEDGRFLSYFQTDGWKQKFSAEYCYPELEFFFYNNDDNIALVQPKDDNKLSIKKFYLHVMLHGDYIGSYTITDKPCGLRGGFLQANSEYLLYLVGVDNNGNEITQKNPMYVSTYVSPVDFKATKIGDRKYRLTWKSNIYPEGFIVQMVMSDQETEIESGFIEEQSYDVDLSDYPEDAEWKCIVTAVSMDMLSASWPTYFDFKESDYA